MADLAPLKLRAHVPPGSNRALTRAVRCGEDALRRSDIDAALREVDRAWRSLPEEAATVAPIYARLLALDGRDHDAALRMAGRAAQFRPDPELEALTVRALLGLHREAEAIQRLEAVLARFCLIPGEALSQAAAQLLRGSRLAVCGWVGVTPSLDFIWQLSDADADSVEIEAAGQTLATISLKVLTVAGRRLYQWKPPAAARDEPFHFRAGGVALLGSGRSARPDFALDGRADGASRSITGWARIDWAPASPLRLRIVDQDGRRAHVTTRATSTAPERWPFRLDLQDSRLHGSRFDISAQLPDGRSH